MYDPQEPGYGPQPGDENLPVQFYMGTVPDQERTEAEGHPCFREVPFIKIHIPGDRNSNVDTLVDERYKARFPAAWKAFQANNDNPTEGGLPLKEWPAITKGQVLELNYMNIRTVEQLAGVPDVHGAKIMGFHELKRKAETYLRAAKDSSEVMRLDAENAALKTELKAQREELKVLSDRFKALEKEHPTKKF